MSSPKTCSLSWYLMRMTFPSIILWVTVLRCLKNLTELETVTIEVATLRNCYSVQWMFSWDMWNCHCLYGIHFSFNSAFLNNKIKELEISWHAAFLIIILMCYRSMYVVLQMELISGDQNGNIRVWDLTANSCSCELVFLIFLNSYIFGLLVFILWS